MQIAVLGTGQVGETIGARLVTLGHTVRIGSRESNNERAAAWVARHAAGASRGTFAEAARFGELVFNCARGSAALDALRLAGADNLAGKVLVDVSNPLEFAPGKPPTLFVGNDDSLGERLQAAFPRARVVKTLNTVNCNVMVDASRLPGEHTMFLCGNDAMAKSQVHELLTAFGWKDVVDLGDIGGARAMEGVLLLWLRLRQTLGTDDFNLRVVR